MPEHPYGWLSIAPPVVAIVLAIVTRRVLVSLFAGLAVGALILSGGNPFTATVNLLETQLWQTVVQPDKLRVFAFSMMLSAMIGVIQISGGMRGLVELLTPWARSRRSGQIVTWLLGLIVFFDDYANCLLIGGTMQPTCDRLRISREKLAFLVDATAAPVAGIAIISTWIAIELEYIREGIASLDPHLAAGLNPFELFLACIPYRFYVIQMLLFLPLVALLKRDFGPMLKAERRAAAGNQPVWATSDFAADPYDDGQEVHVSHWSNAVLPLALTIGVSLWLIYATGAARIAGQSAGLTGFEHFRAAFGSGDSSVALYYGAIAGLLLAVVLARWRVGVAAKRVAAAASIGAKMVLPALAILVLAGTMSRMTGNKSVEGVHSVRPYEYQADRLYTGDYLKEILVSVSQGTTHDFANWFPTIVFLLGVCDLVLHRHELRHNGHFGADGDTAGGGARGSDLARTLQGESGLSHRDGERAGRGDLRRPLFADFGYDDPIFFGQRLRPHGSRQHATALRGGRRPRCRRCWGRCWSGWALAVATLACTNRGPARFAIDHRPTC